MVGKLKIAQQVLIIESLKKIFQESVLFCIYCQKYAVDHFDFSYLNTNIVPSLVDFCRSVWVCV